MLDDTVSIIGCVVTSLEKYVRLKKRIMQLAKEGRMVLDLDHM